MSCDPQRLERGESAVPEADEEMRRAQAVIEDPGRREIREGCGDAWLSALLECAVETIVDVFMMQDDVSRCATLSS